MFTFLLLKERGVGGGVLQLRFEFKKSITKCRSSASLVKLLTPYCFFEMQYTFSSVISAVYFDPEMKKRLNAGNPKYSNSLNWVKIMDPGQG